MNALHKKAAISIGCLILTIAFFAPPATQADEWNLSTRFAISHSFEVPGMVLQSDTPYVIRLLDSSSTRNVVQIYNGDRTQLLTMFIAINAERPEPTDKTEFTFLETRPEYPLPMKTWFYPGRLSGLEFVYPKDQAMEIARHSKESVLAAEGRIEPLNESASTVTKSETTAISEEKPAVQENQPEPAIAQEQQVEQTQIAQNENPSDLKTNTEVQQEKTSEAPAATEENRELPRTAGEIPLFAVVGILCLGAGLGLKVLSAKP
jgi:hypothetical protein